MLVLVSVQKGPSGTHIFKIKKRDVKAVLGIVFIEGYVMILSVEIEGGEVFG